jgi:hypothetical protein
MTREEVLNLSVEAGFTYGEYGGSVCTDDDIVKFAALVAAAEREACHKEYLAKLKAWDIDIPLIKDDEGTVWMKLEDVSDALLSIHEYYSAPLRARSQP